MQTLFYVNKKFVLVLYQPVFSVKLRNYANKVFIQYRWLLLCVFSDLRLTLFRMKMFTFKYYILLFPSKIPVTIYFFIRFKM